MRPACTPDDVERTLASLSEQRAVAGASFPPPGALVDSAGLYAWFVDHAGATHLTAGLSVPVGGGLIYAGQTGATKWPSGRVGAGTLRTRIGSHHLRGRVRGSTFRLTLGGALRASLELEVTAPKRLNPGSEQRLSDWIAAHLRVAIHQHDDRATLGDLERRVLAALDPPLNLEGMAPTPLRGAVSRERAALSRPPTAEAPDRARRGTARRSGADTLPNARPPLHEELLSILTQHGGQWMTTQELAEQVNRRGRYRKRDGTPVTAFQIHGRTRNYPHLFERDGSKVRERR